MRVAIYTRFSSDKQSLSSLDDQERLCRTLAERNRWDVVAVYQDAAVSGAFKDRKGYLALTSNAIAGGFDLVVAESLDRLNRDLEETARLYKRLRFVNVGIHTVSEGPVSEVHVSISGLTGELYLKSLAEKTRRGVEGRVLGGKSGGGRSFGYDVILAADAAGKPLAGERRINSQQADVVREIFRRFASGEGPRSIARSLNNKKFRDRVVGRGGTQPSAATPRRGLACSTMSFTGANRSGVGSALSRTQPQGGASRASILLAVRSR